MLDIWLHHWAFYVIVSWSFLMLGFAYWPSGAGRGPLPQAADSGRR
jgi:hypothetical protein